MRSRLIASFAAGVLISGMVVGGFAVAQPDEVEFTACAKNNNGQMRLVDSGDDCRTSEYPVTWNQAGQPGPPGPEGPPGLSSAYQTGSPELRWFPGETKDLMTFDLPAGPYVFWITIDSLPEPLFAPDGSPAGFGAGGALDCSLYEEAADGTRTLQPSGIPAASSTGLVEGLPLHQEAAQSQWVEPFLPPDTSLVIACEHFFGEGWIDVFGNWVAVPVDNAVFQ